MMVDGHRISRRRALSLTAVAGLGSACSAGRRTRQAADPNASGAARVDEDRPENSYYKFDEAKRLFDSLDWPGTDVPEPKSKVRVTIAITSDDNMEVRHAQFAKFFMERHPTIELVREVTPWNDFLTKYVTQAAGGSLPDLMYSHFSWGRKMVQSGIFAPLNDFIAATPDFDREDFTPAALTYWEKDGELYGVPTDSGPLLLYYNKDIFAAAGFDPPDGTWSWEKVMATAVKLTKGEGAKKVFGFTPMPVPAPDLTTIHLMPYGGRFLSADERRVMIHEEPAQKALRPWLDLQIRHRAVPSLAEMQILENVNPFMTNHAAMTVNGVWIVPYLFSRTGHDRFDFGFTHLPAGPRGRFTPVEGSAFGLSSRSAQPEAAWIVLNAFLSAAGHRFFLMNPPARQSTFERNLGALRLDPDLIRTAQNALKAYGTSDGVLKEPTTQKAIDAATPVWDRVRSGKLPLAEGVRQIRDRVTPVLEGDR